MTAMTELFYRDPYVREFTSKAVSYTHLTLPTSN